MSGADRMEGPLPVFCVRSVGGPGPPPPRCILLGKLYAEKYRKEVIVRTLGRVVILQPKRRNEI